MTNTSSAEDMLTHCKLCGKPVDLTPEHIKFHGTQNWVHAVCHRKDTASLRATAIRKADNHG